MASDIYVGIDVAKDTLFVAILLGGESWEERVTEDGLKRLIALTIQIPTISAPNSEIIRPPVLIESGAPFTSSLNYLHRYFLCSMTINDKQIIKKSLTFKTVACP